MEQTKQFKRIYLEISNICNLQCTFCPTVERTNNIMSDATFQTILSQAAPLSEQICLHVMGEPLGHPNFPLFVEIASAYQTKIQITTNGTLLDEKRSAALLNSAIVQVNFSLQSFYDNFPESDPSLYWRKILTFTNRALLERPDLYINFRLWNLGSQLEEKNEIFFLFLEKEWSISISREANPALQKSKKLKGRAYLHFDSRFQWPRESKNEKSEIGFCHGLSSHVAILADGSVVPCCLDKEADLKLGNCLERPLVELLDSQRAQRIRDGFARGQAVEALCQSCDYSRRFHKKAKRLAQLIK